MVMCIHTYTTLLPCVLKTEDMTVAAAIRNIIIIIFTSTCWKNEGKVKGKPIDTYVIDISTFSYGLSILHNTCKCMLSKCYDRLNRISVHCTLQLSLATNQLHLTEHMYVWTLKHRMTSCTFRLIHNLQYFVPIYKTLYFVQCLYCQQTFQGSLIDVCIMYVRWQGWEDKLVE